MKYKIFAICDPEKEYAARFADYAREHGNIPMDIRMFTGMSELDGFMKEQSIEILLLSDEYLRDDAPEWPVETLVVLERDCAGNTGGRYPCICKYKSAREIIREAMSLCGEKKEEIGIGGEKVLKPACRVVGVYSPVSRCYKTTFALALGQILAREKPTLYLNLEEFSGLDNILHEQQGGSMADVIFMMRQGESDLMRYMATLAGHIASLDYIPPCVSGQELRGVSPEEWHSLIREIADRSSYEAVILDLGNGLGHLEDLLTECDVIYMPVRGDICSNAKLAAFDSFLQISGTGRIAGKMRQIRIQGGNLPETRDRYMQQAVWSDVGDCARDCIRREGL
ncbi:MAG: hypothetical protein Q4A32_12010 [Lachnospiraceae bacterium]|nr:hypothetical protein [Lachnospiraceae bacterium]